MFYNTGDYIYIYMCHMAGSCNWIFLASLLKLKQTKNGTCDPPPHDKNYEKIHIFWTTLTLKNKIHFPVRASRVSIAIWWWDQTDKILFFWKNIPPLGNTSPKSGEGGFCIIFKIWSNTGRPEKKLSEYCWLHGAQAQSPVAGTTRWLLKLWGP